jgi:hypothetical protein
MVAMEHSVLMFESSRTGWKKAYESLKGTHPQCVTFDPNNPNRAYCGTFGGDYGRQMMVDKLGVALERNGYPVQT